jgi:hypothetical protein
MHAIVRIRRYVLVVKFFGGRGGGLKAPDFNTEDTEKRGEIHEKLN